MTKSRQFRPALSDMRLEERVVLSVATASLVAPLSKPVATSAQVSTTLNQIHGALLSYQSSVTNAVLYAQAQIAAGRVTQAAAINLLNGYIGNKTSLLFFQTRAAAGNLPFGAGFNGYLNSTNTAITDTPSGDSLYALLTYPSQTTTGPIAGLQNNVFSTLNSGDFNGTLRAVNSTAIHSTFAQVKNVVSHYVLNGVKTHAFNYQR